MDLFNAGGTGEMERCPLVIAGNQARADAERVEAAYRLRRVRPQCIAERQQTEQRAAPCSRDHGQSLRFEFFDASLLSREIHSLALEKRRAADNQCLVS